MRTRMEEMTSTLISAEMFMCMYILFSFAHVTPSDLYQYHIPLRQRNTSVQMKSS